MPKNRIIIVTAYMLACCIIVGAYSFIVIKEGKKAPKLAKKIKNTKNKRIYMSQMKEMCLKIN